MGGVWAIISIFSRRGGGGGGGLGQEGKVSPCNSAYFIYVYNA